VRVVHPHDIPAPRAVRMPRTDRAEILYYFPHLRIINVEADLIAPRSCPVNSPIRPNRERPNFAAKTGNDFAAILNSICGWIVHKEPHAPRAPRWRSDVVFAIETKRSSGKIKLVTI